MSMLRVLVERHTDLLSEIETELSRSPGPVAAGPLQVGLDQYLKLPDGLCEQLLVVPLQVDATRSRWAVAAANPFDAHCVAELSFHLGGPVDILHTRLTTILDALSMLQASSTCAAGARLLEIDSADTPTFGTPPPPAVAQPAADEVSGAALTTSRSPAMRRGLSLPPVQAPESPEETPVPLLRPRARHMAHREARLWHPSGVRQSSDTNQLSGTIADQVALPQDSGGPISPLSEIFARIDKLQSTRDALSALTVAISSVAGYVSIFSVNPEEFQLKLVVPQRPFGTFVVPASAQSILSTACSAGLYWGPFSPGSYYDERIAEIMKSAPDVEVYGLPLLVAKRPVAVVLASQLPNNLSSTRFIDQVVPRFAIAIERLIHRRRQMR
jgi:hypothetical protein